MNSDIISWIENSWSFQQNCCSNWLYFFGHCEHIHITFVSDIPLYVFFAICYYKIQGMFHSGFAASIAASKTALEPLMTSWYNEVRWLMTASHVAMVHTHRIMCIKEPDHMTPSPSHQQQSDQWCHIGMETLWALLSPCNAKIYLEQTISLCWWII